MIKSTDHSVRSILRWFNPIAWLSDLRRSLTAASVALILVSIVSLNVVWGYPWLGMLAACLAMFVVGRTLNLLSLPKLKALANVPGHVPVGEELGAPIRLINVGRWPGMDLCIEGSYLCRFLAPESDTSVLQTVRFLRRGERQLPPLLVESYFPFYLFRTRRLIDSGATVVATPQRLFAESDKQWRMLEVTLKGIASRSSQGDQVHYIGNQEYREGVPVRRWDFASWARLGKPVLREYSTPASKTLLIVVDNLRPQSARPQPKGPNRWWKRSNDRIDEPFERILSLAAASIETLSRNGAAVVLRFVRGEDGEALGRKYRCESGADPGELLMALGNAKSFAMEPTDQAVWPLDEDVHFGSDGEAVIVLSCRDSEELRRSRETLSLPSGVLWVSADSIETLESGSSDVNVMQRLRGGSDDKRVVI
ncbi:DUF58 domain-containing protein [Neorhodopirellula pilleata]|uniref:Uncharacterized protein n=1 Tax=Neorhodopirellula pilleata TaxID=2714738 RepID=A0A5C5ZN20_9BACT|nr:DUF58 domain-containing protein [Neorhodopirellula pilleata]TWT87843.1 hypothetical protein Pla100_58820 [Neorhodopirellula pilleata]